MWHSLLIGLAINLIKSYISSTSSHKDDLILDLVKDGVDYLANKTNNTVTKEISKELNSKDMVFYQKAI